MKEHHKNLEAEAMAKKSVKSGTKLKFIGGVNRDRIGGNCSIIEHTDEKGETTRVMFDLGTMFTPYESGFNSALPDVTEYFSRFDDETDTLIPATKPVSALFLTHAHEDHIGAMIDYTKMGYRLPPIKASRFTRALVRLAFKQEGLEPPAIDTVKPEDNIKIGDNMVVEPFTVSHSVIGAMGYHTLTFLKDKPCAGIINNGDFLTEENMPVGESFSTEKYQDLLKRKPTTHIELDSTSTRPHGKERIGFEQAVVNTYDVIRANPDRNIIISPVISRSVQNIAIDIETARRLHTKICLDGKWLSLVHQAMTLSGNDDFDDVIYKGKLDKYLTDKRVQLKYIVNTGAFAQGMEEYEQNRSDTSNIPMASATKMALDLHKDLRVNSNVLVIARQRIIDEINGKTGPKMLQLLASKGAKVVMTPSGRKIGNFAEVQMQDSGHVNAQAMGELMECIHKQAPKAVIIPIHGNPQQCQDTADIASQHHLATHLASNTEELGLSKGKTTEIKVAEPTVWVGVKKVYYNPLQPEADVPYEGKTEYWYIDEYYTPLRKIGEKNNVIIHRPGDKDYRVSDGQMFDDKYEDAVLHEPMNNRRKPKTFSKKEKGDAEVKAQKIAARKEKALKLRQQKAERRMAQKTKNIIVPDKSRDM